jgi:hypothetical protein
MNKRKELYESTAAVPAVANVGFYFDPCGGPLIGLCRTKKKSLKFVILNAHLDEKLICSILSFLL